MTTSSRPPTALRIACLAWGSLVWKSGPLALASGWQLGGPVLPIEFARVGDHGELATVLCGQGTRSATRWALLQAATVADAREMLRQREAIDVQRMPGGVGTTPAAETAYPFADEIAAWAAQHSLDAVVWTALPPRIDGHEGRMPTLSQALDYLQGLTGDKRAHAEHYMRSAPAEISTPYRRAIDEHLGWTAVPAVEARPARVGDGTRSAPIPANPAA